MYVKKENIRTIIMIIRKSVEISLPLKLKIGELLEILNELYNADVKINKKKLKPILRSTLLAINDAKYKKYEKFYITKVNFIKNKIVEQHQNIDRGEGNVVQEEYDEKTIEKMTIGPNVSNFMKNNFDN